ncbi:predicted protein [Sclerotinia sclerotiorum 1980 UF-70]|uniref:Uncharacterized protein n=1 Tax=Sclerotinia sclerotiorum (strain ATCC 18683 / 1980 / Ss-1) TaxID=665079 RepID=A7E7Y2_SCLS1|nr:predicted protein [Sclerotinia sclerotiorum 1980 UF-70]EDN96484.1 predicted protein [Sclerotinia sclerotiorum 1980 UF-70]
MFTGGTAQQIFVHYGGASRHWGRNFSSFVSDSVEMPYVMPGILVCEAASVGKGVTILTTALENTKSWIGSSTAQSNCGPTTENNERMDELWLEYGADVRLACTGQVPMFYILHRLDVKSEFYDHVNVQWVQKDVRDSGVSSPSTRKNRIIGLTRVDQKWEVTGDYAATVLADGVNDVQLRSSLRSRRVGLSTQITKMILYILQGS